MEAKKEALQKETSERILIGSPTFQDGLAKLNAMKPLPYGTLHAVGIISISFLLVMLAFYRGIVGGQCFSFFSAFSMQNFYPFQYQTSLKMLLLVFSDSKVQVIMLFNYLTFNLQSLIGSSWLTRMGALVYHSSRSVGCHKLLPALNPDSLT